jgi:hypothetical protein
MTFKHGLRNRAYVSADLNQGGGAVTWSELDLVEGIGHESSRDEAEVVNRRGEHKKYGAGKIDESYTITVTWDPADAAVLILWNAYRNNSVIGFADANGDITTNGTNVVFMDVIVTGAPRPQDLSEYDSVEFTVRPAAESTYEPIWYTIGTTTTTA